MTERFIPVDKDEHGNLRRFDRRANALEGIRSELGSISKRLAYAFPHPKDFAITACPGCERERTRREEAEAEVLQLVGQRNEAHAAHGALLKAMIQTKQILDGLIGRKPALRWTWEPPNCPGLWAMRKRCEYIETWVNGQRLGHPWGTVRLLNVTADDVATPGGFRKHTDVQYCLLIIDEPMELPPPSRSTQDGPK